MRTDGEVLTSPSLPQPALAGDHVNIDVTIKTMDDLPHGQDWCWYPDTQILVLPRVLTAERLIAVLDEARSMLLGVAALPVSARDA